MKKQSNQDHWMILDTLSIRNYYRQYCFYKQINNDSMVFINAFCRILKNPVDSCGIILWKTMNWRNKMLFIDDGGDCNWQILINLTNKKVEYLRINGVG